MKMSITCNKKKSVMRLVKKVNEWKIIKENQVAEEYENKSCKENK